LVDHFYPGAEDEYHQENGDIIRIDQRIISGSRRTARWLELWLETTEQPMIDAGEKPVKDEQGQDKKGIGQEFFRVQQLGDEKIGIQIVKGHDDPEVHDKERGQIPLRESIRLPRGSWNGIKNQWQQQEAAPRGDVNDDLYGCFFQYLNDVIPEHQIYKGFVVGREILDEWGYGTGERVAARCGGSVRKRPGRRSVIVGAGPPQKSVGAPEEQKMIRS
jgi:hypothetical protein